MSDYRDFNGDVVIPSEIQNIKFEIIGGMDLRELKIIGVGIVLTILTAVLVFGVLKQSNSFAILSPAIIFSPFYILAKIKHNGMNLEDWLLIWYSNNFKSRNIRLSEIYNEYERLEKLYLSVQKKVVEDKKTVKIKYKQIKKKRKESKYKGSC